MRLILSASSIIIVILTSFVFGQTPATTSIAPTNVLSGTTSIALKSPYDTLTLQIIPPPEKAKDPIYELLQLFAPYITVVITSVITIVGLIFGLYQIKKAARYNYASEIMKYRLRQVHEFYAPALLLIEQSRIVYNKLRWTISKVMPDFPLDKFRLLDHIYEFKNQTEFKEIIIEILETGEKLTKLISNKSGLIEGGLTSTFIEYKAHFSILNAASKQKPIDSKEEGWHEFVYYPRMLNREIREGFKVVLAYLNKYANAGDKTIFRLLGQKPVEIGKYRRQLLNNLSFYETHAPDYIARYDQYNLSSFKESFITEVEKFKTKQEGILVNILDAGCGSGRDTYEFLNRGYMVTAMDISPALLRECRKKIKQVIDDTKNEQIKKVAEESLKRCVEMSFDEMAFGNEFDGIWAAASLLHVPAGLMEEILEKFVQALKINGILFMSFKYGHGERRYGQRFFTYYAKKDIRAILNRIDSTEKINVWLSNDKGQHLSKGKQWIAWFLEWFGYYNQSLWLNVIVKKRSA